MTQRAGPESPTSAISSAPGRARLGRARDRVLVGPVDHDDLGALRRDRLPPRGDGARRQEDAAAQPAAARLVRHGPAVVAGAAATSIDVRPLAQRALDRPRRAEHLERGQPEAPRLVLHAARRRRGRAAASARSPEARAWKARASATGGGTRSGRTRRVQDEPHAQSRSAAPASVRATTPVSSMLTHSSSACAPSPPGPNMTVGIPAAAMNAASAQ